MEKQLIMVTIPIYDYDTIVYKCEKNYFYDHNDATDGLIYPSIALDTISNCGVINSKNRRWAGARSVRIKFS